MQPSSISRRNFLKSTGLGAAAIACARILPGRSLADTPATQPAEKPLYRFVLLGDTHYDLPEHHDMQFVRQKYPKDISQIKSYIDVSQHHTPALLKRVKQIIQASTVPVPFVLHVGDLVEGLCGSFELASRQFNDALAIVDQAKFGVPFLMCKGNHDITGPGAADAYEKVLLPWLSGQQGASLTSAAFSRRQGEDLFIFFDSYKPDLDWLQQEFDKHADARHTFFMIHQPVVPYNDRVDWIVYSKQSAQPERQRLLEMLGRRHAIVLSGHLHKYSVLDRETPGGRFTQLAVCSVIRSDHPKPREERSGTEAYTPELLDLEPHFEPSTRDARLATIQAEQPNIRRFEYADLPGLSVIDVFATHVQSQVFAGTDDVVYQSPLLA